jgi:ATP-dependent helicase/nuclease subunit A
VSVQGFTDARFMNEDAIKNALIEDEVNRKRALELTSFIVEAPAGAGKTELLTQRYLKLLQTVSAPEEIIAITFTNKAAAEMRLRILDSLIAAANQTPPTQPHKQITYDLSQAALRQAQAHNWQLIENPSRLRIFTIDSLCAHLARQMPLLSRFGAQPKVTDDASILYTQAAEQTLALLEHTAHGEVVKTALRYVENNAAQLTGLLINMLQKRDQWLGFSTVHHEIDAAKLQDTLNHLITASLTDATHALAPALQQRLMPIARFAASQQPASLNIDVLLDWQTPLTAQPNDLPRWRALSDLMLTASGEPRKEGGLNVKFGFPATDEGRAYKKNLAEIIAAVNDTPALHAIRSLPFSADNSSDWQMITALSKLLNLAVAQLWLVFQSAGEVDFVEIAQRATQALGDDSDAPTDLALKLDYQIQHLLVDEFQDTSPSQIKLLEQLTRGWQSDDARSSSTSGDGRTLFCVGDPMQSIYRFRKANVSLFIHAASRGIGDIRLQRLQLYRNNRATPQIVSWINQMFAPLFSEFDDESQGAVKYRASIADANKNAVDSKVEVHAIIKNDGTVKNSTDAAKQAEAEAVIAIIQRERNANPDAKIAVLVSAKNHLTHLVTSLRRSHTDIKFQALEIEALAGRQIVQDLLALTHALHHKADRMHWLAVLRAPWCGLTLHDLHTLAGSNHYATVWSLMQNEDLVNQLSSDGQTRLQHVRAIFEEAFQSQGRTTTSRWVRGVWLMLNGAACLWEQADVIDVQAFFKCMDGLDKQNQFSPERMHMEIEKLFAAPDAQGENLQMMTIHKSKGLEFDTVILLGLGNPTGGNNGEKPLLLWEEVPIDGHTELLAAPFIPRGVREQGQDSNCVSVYDFLATREKVRDANEDARVLYVAATRAERKLHLVGFASKNKDDEFKPAANTPLALLWPTVSQYFHNLQLDDTQVQEQADDIKTSITNFSPQLVRLKQLQMPAVLQTNQQQAVLQHDNTKSSSNPPIATPSLAADAGSLAHLYLELIAKNGLEKWPASRIDACSQSMQFWLLLRGHAKIEVDKYVSLVISALKCTISSPEGAWILASRASSQTELSISSENEEQRIDLTFVENGTRWIIDYKLGLDVTEANAPFAALVHKPQLERYAGLFSSEKLPIKLAVFFLILGKLIKL